MKKSISTTLIVFLLFVQNSRADHTAGADLSYVYLGSNLYQINLNLYTDCSSTSKVNSQQPINFSNSCDSLPPIQVNLTNPGGTEISQLCPSQLSNSTCNGGTLRGMRLYHYTGKVIIPSACYSWIISWDGCCRNVPNNLQTLGSSTYLEAQLNNTTFIGNSSPVFSAQPIPYVCVNQVVDYNLGIADPDSDSLYFSLINAMAPGMPKTMLTYVSGYSALLPIPGITIDHNTGQLHFIPTTIGNFVVVILIQEYHNGILVGSVIRDMQFVVQSCPNTVPVGTFLNLENATIKGTQTIEVCEGNYFTLKTKYTDADASDVLLLSSDITKSLPGSTITTVGLNPVIGTINWTPPPGSANNNYTFKFSINDNSCPIPAQQSYLYFIKILPACPIKDTSMLFIPNVFTPGGLNSTFKIGSYGIVEYSIQIFNRWGNKVFESIDVNTHWDGNNVSDGTYYFLIKAKGIEEKMYDRRGFVERIGVN